MSEYPKFRVGEDGRTRITLQIRGVLLDVHHGDLAEIADQVRQAQRRCVPLPCAEGELLVSRATAILLQGAIAQRHYAVAARLIHADTKVTLAAARSVVDHLRQAEWAATWEGVPHDA